MPNPLLFNYTIGWNASEGMQNGKKLESKTQISRNILYAYADDLANLARKAFLIVDILK